MADKFEKLGELSKSEQITALALNEQRQKAVEQLREVDQAVQEYITTLAERRKLPPDQYFIQQTGNQLTLVRSVPAEPTEGEEKKE